MKTTLIVLVLALIAAMSFAGAAVEQGATDSGAAVRTGQYGEAPMLAALVASGELPPVQERLPEVPRVLEVEEIGSYGGALQQVRDADKSDWLAWTMSKEPLTIIAPDLQSTLPNVVQEYRVSADGTMITFKLRNGMRWSDGEPFTIDDVMFWYEDVLNNRELTPEPANLFARDGKLMVVRKVDDQTFTFNFSKPNSPFVDMMGTWWMYWVPQYAPKHHLSQFHPTYTSRTKLDGMMNEAGFSTWPELYQSKDCVGSPAMGVHDPACPTLAPWLNQNPKTARCRLRCATRTTGRSIRRATSCPTSTAWSAPWSQTPRRGCSRSWPARRT